MHFNYLLIITTQFILFVYILPLSTFFLKKTTIASLHQIIWDIVVLAKTVLDQGNLVEDP